MTKMIRLIVFGDSIPAGCWDSEGGWVDRFKREMNGLYLKTDGETKVQVYNLCIGGEKLFQMLNRLESEIKARDVSEWETAVLLSSGINDSRAEGGPENFVSSPEKYEQDVRRAFAIARKFTDKIAVAGFSAVDETRKFKSHYFNNVRIKLFEDVLIKTAVDEGIPALPVHDGFKASVDLSTLTDGVHPNDDGHAWLYSNSRPFLHEFLGVSQ